MYLSCLFFSLVAIMWRGKKRLEAIKCLPAFTMFPYKLPAEFQNHLSPLGEETQS